MKITTAVTNICLSNNKSNSQPYWKRAGNKEAEFIAHAFENRFSGNEVFKKYMPDLYEDMIKMVKEFKPK